MLESLCSMSSLKDMIVFCKSNMKEDFFLLQGCMTFHSSDISVVICFVGCGWIHITKKLKRGCIMMHKDSVLVW